MSYEEFLSSPSVAPHSEWVNRKVIPMSPVSKEHQHIAGFLLTLLRFFVEERRLGEICHDPFQMKTGPELPGRAPDILFVRTENLSRLKENYLDGPADLVVEIISPGSRSVDRGEKFYEYEQGGVKEYWLIDLLRRQGEFYQLNPQGVYHLAATDASGRYQSVVLDGLWLQVDWLWQRPLPTLRSVLKEWKLV